MSFRIYVFGTVLILIGTLVTINYILSSLQLGFGVALIIIGGFLIIRYLIQSHQNKTKQYKQNVVHTSKKLFRQLSHDPIYLKELYDEWIQEDDDLKMKESLTEKWYTLLNNQDFLLFKDYKNKIREHNKCTTIKKTNGLRKIHYEMIQVFEKLLNHFKWMKDDEELKEIFLQAKNNIKH